MSDCHQPTRPGSADSQPSRPGAAPDPRSGRLPALDGLRAVGAIAVLVHHVGFQTAATVRSSAGGWFARMDVGVAVFFVLSGFLLFRPFAAACARGSAFPGVRRYLWRRAVRILPAYWLAMVVIFVLAPGEKVPGASMWVRHLTLTQIYLPHGLHRSFSQTWSLATEAVFYLLLPLIAVLTLGRQWRPVRTVARLAGMAVLTAVWLVAVGIGAVPFARCGSWFPSYAAWFAAGMVLATVHVAGDRGDLARLGQLANRAGGAPVACWTLAGGLLAVGTTPLAGPRGLDVPSGGQIGFKTGLYLVIAVLVLIPAAFGPPTRARAVLGGVIFRWLGELSYGLFLWHLVVLHAVYALTGTPQFTGDPLAMGVLTLVGGLIAAAASYHLVERPLQRRLAGRPQRPRTQVEAQSAASAANAASCGAAAQCGSGAVAESQAATAK